MKPIPRSEILHDHRIREHLPVTGPDYPRGHLRGQRDDTHGPQHRRLRPGGAPVRPLLERPLRGRGPAALLGGRGMIGGGGAMLALAGLAGLLLVVAVVSGWQGTSRLTGRGDDARAVEETAQAFVEAYGTFDFRDPDSYRERLLTLTPRPA